MRQVSWTQHYFQRDRHATHNWSHCWLNNSTIVPHCILKFAPWWCFHQHRFWFLSTVVILSHTLSTMVVPKQEEIVEFYAQQSKSQFTKSLLSFERANAQWWCLRSIVLEILFPNIIPLVLQSIEPFCVLALFFSKRRESVVKDANLVNEMKLEIKLHRRRSNLFVYIRIVQYDKWFNRLSRQASRNISQ